MDYSCGITTPLLGKYPPSYRPLVDPGVGCRGRRWDELDILETAAALERDKEAREKKCKN